MKLLFKGALFACVFSVTLLAISNPTLAQDHLDSSIIESSRDFATLPLTIGNSGLYKLKRSIQVQSGDAITITADSVTLDLDGHTVSTQAAHTGRGIFVNGATGVRVINGRVAGFASNVMVMNSVNVNVENLQITGGGFQPGLNGGGPSEVGIQLLNSRGGMVRDNNISSVNLGIFVRGGESTGNRIFGNTIVGGAIPANNLLGICYNPAPGEDPAGPRGDLIYNNHIARFGFAVSVSAGSINNIFRENNLASFTAGFRGTNAFTTGGGTNVAEGNLEVQLPATSLIKP
ncbi:MAG: hypothetical protein HYR56_18475 [Acidobacteria bacterium]|nr:hypothetical protein [Acidobacteriota bacterium]MBI3428186.1 hypothetical protein [Acidobacteriota bacterium]